MRRVLRYLRIAFSATCGIVCVLLIIQWVRSYWWMDQLRYTNVYTLEIDSWGGGFLTRFTNNPARQKTPLQFKSLPAPEDAQSTPYNYRFRVYTGGGSSYVRYSLVLPYFYVVPIAAFLAAFPWIRWSKRFSLRALLIATTFLALVLGLVVWLRR